MQLFGFANFFTIIFPAWPEASCELPLRGVLLYNTCNVRGVSIGYNLKNLRHGSS